MFFIFLLDGGPDHDELGYFERAVWNLSFFLNLLWLWYKNSTSKNLYLEKGCIISIHFVWSRPRISMTEEVGVGRGRQVWCGGGECGRCMMESSIVLYHSLSPIPNTLYRCIRLYIKNQYGRVGRVSSLREYPEITEPI
jgi:hypothetical protein